MCAHVLLELNLLTRNELSIASFDMAKEKQGQE